MKFVAKVKKVLVPDIHKVFYLRNKESTTAETLPLAEIVVIEMDDDGSCMMFRYTRAGEFCGDTWHENLDDAYSQAEFEYGLVSKDFLQVLEGGALT